MTLAEFLKARVAEDEDDWRPRLHLLADAAIADRILLEAEAKWQILAAYDATAETDTRQAGVGRAALAHVLRCLAAVYADHPDYDPEWSPDA